ncbi:FecR protein [Planctomycetes bacterium MalM25]|nr:FecR protein [Planctomycetes bacterium MalM25]
MREANRGWIRTLVTDKQAQLVRCLESLCNGTLGQEEEQRLIALLRSDAEARQLYTDYLEVHLSLVEHARKGHNALPSEFVPTDASPADDPPPAPSSAPSSWRFVQAAWLATAAMLLAAVTLGVATWWAPWGAESGIDRVAEAPTPQPVGEPSPRPPSSESAPYYIAQLSNLTPDVAWSETTSSQEFLLRVRRGERIGIDSGLVQIEYYSGARIILQGPCDYVLTGENSGRLERGQLTGHVSKGDFVLTTPNAEVIDLGTEFGVAVNGVAKTEVCVFDGEVQVVAGHHSDDDPASSVFLTEGMAARVALSGKIADAPDLNLARFSRNIPDLPSEAMANGELSLVDILARGGDGGRRLAGVIAPDTGEADRHPWLRDVGPGYSVSSGYRSTSWHPFIDGAFIPSRDGQGVQIDSSGHTVSLPQSTGRTWGPIWARRKMPGATAISSQEDYWGTDTLEGVIERLRACDTGMVGIHSNVGVTIDLGTVRDQLRASPLAFRTIVSNLDNSLKRLPEWVANKRLTADLRVYIDGELRAERLDFGRVDGELTLEAPLTSEDRFLTIVCTDASGTFEAAEDAYDHVVIIDPVLRVAKQAE